MSSTTPVNRAIVVGLGGQEMFFPEHVAQVRELHNLKEKPTKHTVERAFEKSAKDINETLETLERMHTDAVRAIA